MKLLEKSGNFVSPGKERTILFRSNLGRYIIYISQHLTGWPRHRENREFGSYFFQTGKTQGILL